MSILAGELTTVALCWRIERRDGAALGFTSHDRDLAVDGLVYRASPGMLPSAVSLSDGFDADGFDVRGALTSDAIDEEDLSAGRYDGAAVAIFMIDWEDPAAAAVPLARGTLGDVTMRRNGFEAELRGPAAALERAVVERTSPECRAELGDKRCRVDMAGRRRLVRVTAVAGETELDVAAALANDSWRYGRARWIGGRNSGLEVGLAGSEGSRLKLRDPPPFPAVVGDLIEIAEGCDRSLATCSGRFGNSINFRGEPHLPGMDLLTRYPGAPEKMERGGEAVAARARSLVGCRYRFQGRSRAEGFDCVGVAAFALGVEALGKRRAYALRGGDLGTLEAELRDAGLECCRSVAPTIGDLILFAPGVAQLHLAIFAGTGFIHADLGLRKVVERPLPAPWPLLSIWRQAL